VVDETVVKVLTTQVGVSGSSLNLEDTLLDGQQGHVEGTTSQVEDEDILLSLRLLIETVSDSSSGRLVDDSKDIETSNHTSIFSGLSLRVVEVGWNGNNGFADGTAEVSLSSLLHLDQDHGRDLLWRLTNLVSQKSQNFLESTYENLLLSSVFNLNVRFPGLVNDLERPVLHIGLDLIVNEFSANQTLGIENSVVWVHGDLVFGGISDQTFRVVERNV
jgi:hypothetical protein